MVTGMVKVNEMVKEKMVKEVVTAAVAMTAAAAAAMKEAHTRHTAMNAAHRWWARPVAAFAGRGATGGVHYRMLKPVRVRRRAEEQPATLPQRASKRMCID